MEFITTYQLPLIVGGLLTIMGFIGYEADRREKIKSGVKPPKAKKRWKKGQDQGQSASSLNMVTVVAPESGAIDSNYQYDEAVANIEAIAQPDIHEETPVQVVVEPSVVNEAPVMVANSETLQQFMEPTDNYQNRDTFGTNDMSSFQVPQNNNADSAANSIDAWKL